MKMASPAMTCGYMLLSMLLVTGVSPQNCKADHSKYASDFDAGTSERWLYENIAPGAECVSIARTPTEGK